MLRKHRKAQTKLNKPMCFACVLLCLTLFSIHITSGLYAKYTVTATGNDGARVILFKDVHIDEEGDFIADTETGDYDGGDVVFIPGVDMKKDATVRFDGSESATYVLVEYVLSSHWEAETSSGVPTGKFKIASGSNTLIDWSVASGWTYLTTVTGSGETTYVFYRILDPGEKLGVTDGDGGTLIANHGSINVSEDMTKNQIASMDASKMFIDLRATVVQAGGFDNAMAAWTSIAAKGGH